MQSNVEKIDSLILAGGFGHRLSPLTDTLPKPMIPIAGTGALERNLELLRRHGFMSTAVTTMYLPEKVEAVKTESGRLEFLRETRPLGSAGAAARLKGRVGDCVIVMSGDAICDYDLSKAKEEFVKSGCSAGILLSRVTDSGEFGSVCVRNGRVTAFLEKPSVRDTVSDLVNTGIYFLTEEAISMIPDNTFFDFARDLFPEILKSDSGIAGIVPEGHWFDIGSFGELHKCSMWLSGGESCIGRQVSVHPNARIERAVIFDGCTVGDSVLRGCIVGEGAVIGNECIIPQGCVIGPNAEIITGTSLSPGTVIASGEKVEPKPFTEMFSHPLNHFELSDDAIISDGSEGFFVRLGKTLGRGGSIVAFAEGSGMTLPYACELACGVSESGSRCTVISGGSAAVAAFCALSRSERVAHIGASGKNTEIRLFSENGMPFSREELRKLSGVTPCDGENAGHMFLLPHGALLKRFLVSLKAGRRIPKRINVDGGSESALLRECVSELGIAPDGDGEVYRLRENGSQASALTQSGHEISYWQLLAICCIECGDCGGILLPRDTPEAVERLLKRHSIDVGFFSDSDSDERTLAGSDRLPRDGVRLALTARWICEKKGKTLSELADALPPFSVNTRIVFADRDKMSGVISRLRERCGGERAPYLEYGEGRVSVFASAAGRFRLIAEAVDSETAEEIALKAEKEIEKELE